MKFNGNKTNIGITGLLIYVLVNVFGINEELANEIAIHAGALLIIAWTYFGAWHKEKKLKTLKDKKLPG